MAVGVLLGLQWGDEGKLKLLCFNFKIRHYSKISRWTKCRPYSRI